MAGAVVGGAFLSASLQVLFDKLAPGGIGGSIWGREHEERLLLEKLTAKLLSVEAILKNAVKRQTPNPVLTEWLRELEASVHEAQSLLDGSKIHSRRDRRRAVQDILERLEHMSGQKDVLHLIEMPSHISTTTSISAHESEIYGRVDDREGIVRTLLPNHAADEEDPIQVLGIVGVSGVGKTTLAQLVYNDQRVVEHFDIRVWVCLSSGPSIRSVTKNILKAVASSSAGDVDDLDLLQLGLGERLAGKKLLLVLDDVRSVEDCIEEWEVLRGPFRFCAPGSGIIVTTQSEEVAETVGTLPAFRLNPLSNEDCWYLFSNYAFYGGYADAGSELESIGRDIANKCNGLPLAAKTLGVLLRGKPDPEEWNKILNDDVWDSSRDVSDMLLRIGKGTTKARNGIQEEESRTERRGSINSKRSRLGVYFAVWLIALGIASGSAFKIAEKFHSNKRKEALGNMCSNRAKTLQDQFKHHVDNSYSLVVFLIQIRKLELDNDQCGKALSDYVSGTDSMFPFIGAVTFEELHSGNDYRSAMACRETETGNPLALPPLISNKTDIMNAIATGETVISRPFHGSHPHHLRFALIVPLYSVARFQRCNSTREQRIIAGSAYIAMIFNFDELAEHVLGQLDGNQTISVAVHDVTDSSEYFLLCASGDYDRGMPDVHESKLELGDLFRKYTITCRYRQKAQLSWMVLVTTGFTAAIVALLGCMFLGAAVHNVRVRELEDRAQASDAANASFLRSATREISIPAKSIFETLVLVLGMELSSPQKDYVRVAQEGCKRLIALIDEVADARTPAGIPILHRRD